MKRFLFILLLLPMTLAAQSPGPGFGFWKSSAPAAWTPLSIDSTKGWYVAADIADSLGKLDGDTTYIWPNRAKWSRINAPSDLYQLTSSKKPLFRADSNVVVFDGVDDVMQSLGLTLFPQPSTVYIVLRDNATDYSFATFCDGIGLGAKTTFRYSASGTQMDAGTFISSFRNLSVDTVYVFGVVANGASSSIRANGATHVVGNAGSGSYVPLIIGTRYDGVTHPAPQSVREIIVIHKALNASETTQIESYLATKYGVTLP